MSLSSNRAGAPDNGAPGPDAPEIELAITGMTCRHCVGAVSDALDALPGVIVHEVRIGHASVALEPEGASPADVIDAIRNAGYQASFAGTVAQGSRAGLPQATASCCATR